MVTVKVTTTSKTITVKEDPYEALVRIHNDELSSIYIDYEDNQDGRNDTQLIIYNKHQLSTLINVLKECERVVNG